MTEQLPFNGIMNLDDNNNVFPPACHKHARNIIFKGNPGNYRAENIPGTRQISYTLPDGHNECIGSFYDALRLRTIWFNFNSNGNHGIYQLNGNVVTPITVCGDDTDYLNFNFDTIHSINILYADDDLLFFVDTLKRPTKININRAIAGDYGIMQRSFIDVAKEPPTIPPVVTYQDDPDATVNSLRKALYQFKYRWKYDDKEKSAWSPISEMPVPEDYLEPASDTDPTRNSSISVTMGTGDRNVKEIEVAARKNLDSTYGDFYLLATVKKEVEGLIDNSDFIYLFKGNNASQFINVQESTLLYDYVPREANTQELLNGNIVIYGGIKEGYDFGQALDVTMTVDWEAAPHMDDYNIDPIYNFWSKYKFGLVYYDEKGRTNGVVTNSNFNISTSFYNAVVDIPRINASINHRPPIWATTFQWVRTKNLSVGNFLYWISNETYKDDKFAYIGIENLFFEKDEKDILSYDFTPGDRIRFAGFIGRDYAISDMIINPEIGSINRTGNFIKIPLPDVDLLFDFGEGFANHLVVLYTPAQVVDKDLHVYYEFGEAYTVQDPGLNSRFHSGQSQDQTPDLTQPATFSFTRGDVYLKSRTVETGSQGKFHVHAGDAWSSLMIVGRTLDSQVSTNETYLLNGSDFNERNEVEIPTDDTQWIIKTIGEEYTFQIKGTIKVSTPVAVTYRVWLEYSDGDVFTQLGATQVDVIPNYNLVVGDNTIEFNVTFTVPVNTRVFLVSDNSASQVLHYYTTNFTIGNTASTLKKVVDANFSDTFLSAVNSNGRPLIVDETGETYNPTMVRYSEAYQSGTNINNTNRFYPLNYDEYDRARGDIRRLKVRANLMHVLQARGCGSVPIFQQILTNADGSTNLMQSDRIINKIRYYQGEYGMGNQPASLASSAGADYFSDPVRGYQCRLAGDGITPISELYKARYYMPPILKKYLSTQYVNEAGSESRLLGCYDFLNEDFLTVFQRLNDDGVSDLYLGDTLSFNEPDNAYRSFHDFCPESIVCAGTTLISWKSGIPWVHDDEENRNTFYGVVYPSVIERVVNMNSNVKKEFTSLGYHAANAWGCPTIETDLGQLSNLIPEDFDWREGMFTSEFFRDVNSLGGLIDGDFLKSMWMQIRLINNRTDYQMLFGLYVNYLISTKNF